MADQKKYTLTDEHRAQLKPWADRWIANALRTTPMTDADRETMRVAMRGLYGAAKLDAPPPTREVFVASPKVAAFASGIAAGVWWLRENPSRHAAMFGRVLTEREIRIAMGAACAVADGNARLPPVKMSAATSAATDDATRDATYAATSDATYAATRDATYDATSDATYAATRDATYDATDAATRDATRDATSAATDAATSAATRDATRDATYAATDDATDAATYAATSAATDAATSAATRDATRDATDAATRDATYAATSAATDDATRDATDAATYAAGTSIGAVGRFLLGCAAQSWRFRNGGNQWSGWAAYLSFFRHVAKLPIDYSKFAHYESAAIHGGPRYMHAKFWIVSDFPTVIGRDERNRSHSASGPSIAWRDGFRAYRWHGLPVPEHVIERPETITVAEIDAEQNTELRRVMIERYGESRFMQDAGAVAVDRDTDHRADLYRREVRDDEPIVMLRLEDATMIDGKRKVYWERVPPTMRRAREALAWQAGVSEADYRPEVES